jgi:hypothetical protein
MLREYARLTDVYGKKGLVLWLQKMQGCYLPSMPKGRKETMSNFGRLSAC